MARNTKSAIATAKARADNTKSLRLLTVFSFLFVALIFSAAALASDKDPAPIRILAYGDSLMAGYQLPPHAGFTVQLQKRLDAEGLNTEVVNAAVSGDTTAGGLARLDWSTPNDIDLVLLELGANDALQGLPVDKAKENLAAMIEKFEAKEARVLLVGMRAPPNMGPDYVGAFDSIYPELAATYNLALYPFFLEDVAAQNHLNLRDGIHPNEEGIAIIVEKIAPHVIDSINNLH